MDSYTSFAYVYDTFMDQEPYDQWADRVCDFLDRYGLPAEDDISEREEILIPEREECSETARIFKREESTETEEMSGKEEISESEDQEEFGRVYDERRIVVDLGCGTGKLTEILAARGYDMIGLDLSEDMLSIAMDRMIASGSDILYTLQDMRDFELYGAVGAMVSVGDSVNYLLEEEGLASMFRCVERYLLPGGVFVFDFKTVHLYRDVIGDRTIAEDRGNCAFIWDNYYDQETCINEYDLAVFVALQEDGSPIDGSECGEQEEAYAGENRIYRRFDEIHYQRGYEPEQIRRIAENAGLVWITSQDAETGEEVTDNTERVMAAVRKR